MPKNVKGGKVEVEVTDKGSLKQLGKNARQAGKDVGSVAKNTAESDRRLKSLSNQTSNSTKAFSKQAQTISGGLVPIYATLAAQVFAVSAAFRFLQEASDFKNLIAGQEAYGAFTGTMYKKLAGDIRRATSAQISYAEASQAAAIGIASGLNATQLSQLGEAAANVSLILGRDVTDSFNRLIRGVTKAEPELLDELGIVLRLDPALKNYAAQLGKTKEELNAFERSQAVAAEVIGQAEEKFGGVQAIMDPTAFAFNQFAQAFNDLMDDLKVGLGGIAQTVLPFFTKNVGALIGALGLFAIPIVKQLLPNFKALEDQSKNTINSLNNDIKRLARESRTLDIAAEVAGGSKAGAKKLASDAKKGLKGFGIKGDLSQRQIAAYRTSAEKRLGIAKDMNKKELQQFKMHLKNLEIAQKTSLSKREREVQKSEVKKQQKMKETELKHAENQRAMTRATQIGAKAMNAAFKAMGFIGLGLMVFDFGRMAVEAIVGVDEEAEKLKEKLEGIADATLDANDSMRRMIELRKKDLVTLTQTAQQAAKAIQSIGIGESLMSGDLLLSQDLSNIMKEIKEFVNPGGGTGSFYRGTGEFTFADTELGQAVKGQIDQFRNLAALTADPQTKKAYSDYAQFIDDIARGNKTITDAKTAAEYKNLKSRVLNLSNALVQLNQSAESYSRTTKKVTEVTADFLNKFAPATSSTKAITAFEDNIKAIRDNIKTLTTEIDAADKEREIPGFYGPFSKTAKSQGQIDAENKRRGFRLELIDNLKMLDILQEHSTAEAKILVSMEQQKALKARILQDGSILAAQANQAIAKELKRLQLKKLENDINYQNKILEEEADSLDSARAVNAQNSKDIAEAKLTVLEQELDMMDRLVFLEQKRAAIELRQKTGGAGMFGLRGNLTADQIAKTKTALGMTEEEAISYLQAANKQFNLVEKNFQTMEAASQRVGSALTDGIADALLAIVDGTKSAKEAFKQLAASVIADITKMMIRMAIMNAMMAMFGGGTGQGAQATIATLTNMGFDSSNIATTGSGPDPFTAGFDFTGVRSGGIMSSPGYRSYARGGVAMGPDSGYMATLHGTEAVVPLGNSRSIPVELKGAGGGVNNVTVNISTDGTVSTEADAQTTKDFGRQVSNVVIREIEIQKRPGGLLAR